MYNIVTATFKNNLKRCQTLPLWQYDHGQILHIEGLDLPDAFEIHFANVGDTTAKKAVVTENEVEIYDEYLESGEDIIAYFFYHSGLDDGETEYVVYIPVNNRQKATDETPTPVQQDAIDQAIAALNAGVIAASGYADTAEECAEDAGISKDRAEEILTELSGVEENLSNLTAEAITLPGGEDATAEYQDGVLTFGIPRGDTGPEGPQGIQGPEGPQGPQGIQGERGPQGPQGVQGPRGAAGPQGDRGYPGAVGPKGEKGDPGATGATGPAGPAGPTGADGYTPVKGTDYWTEEDKTEIIEEIPGFFYEDPGNDGNIEITTDGAVEPTNLAEAYDSTSAYAVGDYVVHNGLFYICTTAIVSGEAWNPSHWLQVTVGEELSDYKAEINELMPETNDLSQWLFAENKYYNSNLELTDRQGFNTYKIPCDVTDCIVMSWTGDTVPWGTLGSGLIWVYEDANGLSRSLTAKNRARNDTGKRVWFVAPEGAKAFYLTFLSERTTDVKIEKNTSRKHSECSDVADNFIIPINADTAIDANGYYNYTPQISLWDNTNYHSWWIHAKAGDVIKIKSADPVLSYYVQICDVSGTITRLSDLTITLSTNATVIVFEKVTTNNNAILIPQGAKLGIDAENVIGLTDKITENIAPIASEVADIDGRVDGIEIKLNATDIVYSTGDTNGYYRVKVSDGSIEFISSSSFKCQIVEVQEAMMSVAFEIKSVSGISGNIIYCGFADENHGFISKVDVAVGVYDLEIPSNAKYIYLSFFGATYNSDYTIRVNGIVTQKQLDGLGISNPYDGISGIAFGTSLTYRAQTTGGYLQHLPDMSGMTIDNQGVGSSFIFANGDSPDMLAKIKAYTGYSDKRICLFEGFVNDWYYNKTIGTYTDTTETSVCGCVRSAINYMLSQNANLTIFLILDPYGRNYSNVDCSSSAVNGSGLTQYSFYEEVAKVGESLGIPVIKMYAESQISQNTPQYILDNIHPNALGAKQSANFIWSKIRQYYPNA